MLTSVARPGLLARISPGSTRGLVLHGQEQVAVDGRVILPHGQGLMVVGDGFGRALP